MCVFLDDPGLPLIGFGFRNGMCSYVCGLGLGDCGELRARGRLKWRLGCRVMADKRPPTLPCLRASSRCWCGVVPPFPVVTVHVVRAL